MVFADPNAVQDSVPERRTTFESLRPAAWRSRGCCPVATCCHLRNICSRCGYGHTGVAPVPDRRRCVPLALGDGVDADDLHLTRRHAGRVSTSPPVGLPYELPGEARGAGARSGRCCHDGLAVRRHGPLILTEVQDALPPRPILPDQPRPPDWAAIAPITSRYPPRQYRPATQQQVSKPRHRLHGCGCDRRHSARLLVG